MSVHEFSPGCVVRLRSGGPKMTVDAIDNKGRVVCCWFNDKAVCRSDFDANSLTLLKKPKTQDEDQ